MYVSASTRMSVAERKARSPVFFANVVTARISSGVGSFCCTGTGKAAMRCRVALSLISSITSGTVHKVQPKRSKLTPRMNAAVSTTRKRSPAPPDGAIVLKACS
eukprot:Mycagemm_TRINITY_DN10290_c0_g3::TRINITY_DN10290_c0_g3_i4::g.3857::m.3857 type:complete len:104 gc:universal TRINITY_DN10290_c0_g3_i4:333-22(-)